TASRRPMMGTLMLGLALAATGCGPQDEASVSDHLQSVSQYGVTDRDYAVVYADAFTGGPYQYLLPGRYTASQLTSVGVNTISSVLVPVGWRVTLYSADNFTGTSQVVRHDTDLSTSGFDNKTMSINVERSVTIYRNDGYRGEVQYLDIGTYDAPQLTIGDNTLTSLRVAPGWKVTLYSAPGFTGTSYVVTSDRDLWATPAPAYFNDQTSSIKVEGPVTLYSDAYYAGSVQGIQAGFYSAPQLGYMAQKLSSLRVAPGWTVTLYSGNDFFGDTRVITADTNWLGDLNFNDQTGSIKVEGPNL
ncbi:MAG TPA: beta/gamma crystallin-related protein, partial [Myxococcaceae bacterium]